MRELKEIEVGLVGLGFVGSALKSSFEKLGAELRCFDKYKNGGVGRLEDVLGCDIVFLCLPTPYSDELDNYDLAPLREVCSSLQSNSYQGAVVIKSTILPGTSDMFSEDYQLNIIHNPEFLSAKTAVEDFHNQSHIVIGKTKRCSDELVNTVCFFYEFLYPVATFSRCTAEESELMKMTCNCFYATKIQFFNEIYCATGCNQEKYDNVIEMCLKNGWINPMHTKVPGTDGKLSYGGLCFPKDTSALLSHLRRNQQPSKVLGAVVEEQKEMRDDHENLTRYSPEQSKLG